MKIKLILVLGIAIVALAGWPSSIYAQQPEKTVLQNYTLQQCITYALEHSNAISNARIDAQIAQSKVGEVKSAGLPQVNAQFDLMHNVQAQRVFFYANRFDPRAASDQVGIAVFQLPYSGIASVSLNQMIFNGSYFLGLKAAHTFTQLSEKAVQQSQAEITGNVSKAYYGVLINENRLQLLEQNYLRLEQLHKDTRAMLENGLIEKIDLDRIEVTMNNLTIERQKLRRIQELSMALLKFQMGMQDEDELSLGENLEKVNLEAVLAAPSSETDYSKRPEFSILTTQRELDLLNIRNRRSGYLPSLFFVASGGANTGVTRAGQVFNIADRWYSFFFYGIRLNVPVFDGLHKSHQVQQSKLALIKTENNLRELRRSINMQVKQATLVLQNHLESLNAQKKNMELAAEVSRVTRLKYKEGIGSNLEVLNAETSFKEAETNYYSALYDALIAKIDLDKAKGEILK